jgi:circadian clock protein KaiB
MKKLSPRSRPAPSPAPARAKPRRAAYHFQLYVTGNTPRSTQAVANLRALCDEHLPGAYDLEVIDIYQEPARAAIGQIIASPTLVKTFPLPLFRMVGNLANRARLLIKLDLANPDVPLPAPVAAKP